MKWLQKIMPKELVGLKSYVVDSLQSKLYRASYDEKTFGTFAYNSADENNNNIFINKCHICNDDFLV